MKEFLLKILPYVIIGLIIFFYVQSCNENIENAILERQNHLAKVNDLKKINDSTYQKYASVCDLNTNLLKELKQNKETILAQNKIIFSLKNMVSQVKGEVVKDTVFVRVPSNCIGLRLAFADSNSFYSYTDSVTVANPPEHKLSLYFKPISVTSYLTRNEEGIWSGYLQFNDEAKKHINIASFSVEVEKDFYLNSFATEFSLLPYISISSNMNSTNFVFGAFGIIGDKHLVGYGKAINSNYHTITYGYKLNF